MPMSGELPITNSTTEVNPMFAAIRRAACRIPMGAIALAALSGAGGVAAQPYPNKPIRLFVGFPPGGGSDALARMLGAALPEKLSQQILVDNRPGANSSSPLSMSKASRRMDTRCCSCRRRSRSTPVCTN